MNVYKTQISLRSLNLYPEESLKLVLQKIKHDAVEIFTIGTSKHSPKFWLKCNISINNDSSVIGKIIVVSLNIEYEKTIYEIKNINLYQEHAKWLSDYKQNLIKANYFSKASSHAEIFHNLFRHCAKSTSKLSLLNDLVNFGREIQLPSKVLPEFTLKCLACLLNTLRTSLIESKVPRFISSDEFRIILWENMKILMKSFQKSRENSSSDLDDAVKIQTINLLQNIDNKHGFSLDSNMKETLKQTASRVFEMVISMQNSAKVPEELQLDLNTLMGHLRTTVKVFQLFKEGYKNRQVLQELAKFLSHMNNHIPLPQICPCRWHIFKSEPFQFHRPYILNNMSANNEQLNHIIQNRVET